MDGEFEVSKNVTNEDQNKIEENLLKNFITPLLGKSANRYETNKLIRRRSEVVQDQVVGLDSTLSPAKQPIDNQFSAITNKTYKLKNTLFISLYGKGKFAALSPCFDITPNL